MCWASTLGHVSALEELHSTADEFPGVMLCHNTVGPLAAIVI